MIYRDGQVWDGWAKKMGSLKLKKDVTFVADDQYKSHRQVGEGTAANPYRRVVTYSPMIMVQPVYSYTDPDTNQTHEVRYVERTSPLKQNDKGSGAVGKFQPEVIEIINGVLRVPKARLDLYWFLTNHTENRSNPIYDKDDVRARHQGTFQFYLKDEEKEMEASFQKESKLQEATSYALSRLSDDQAKEMYASYYQSDGDEAPMSRIRMYLNGRAKENPDDFMARVKSDDKKFKALVADAVNLGIIEFNKSARFWKYLGSDQSICSVLKGKEPNDALVYWLRKDDVNGEVFKNLTTSIGLARAAKQTAGA